ncbi:tyrosine-protein phosphatase [Microbacterium sp.]|uniref:tyrosine-protein phosphatase n=1 Tax=Microbacterium sp. TaxID=51671 RepID=UPI0039E477BA
MGELAVSGSMNLRDTGGLPAGTGTTRHGVLFRSGSLSRIDDAGRERLRELGLRRVIDLRDDDEVRRDPTRLEGVGHETLRLPLFAGSVASLFEGDLTLAGLYRGMVDDSADRIVEVVRGVIGTQPVLVHCSAGKDRTGVTIALALAAAGVDEDAVIADYARTETLLPAERNAQIVAYLRREHPGAANLEELATRSPAPVMRGLLDDLRARFGAPVEFLRANGLGDDELAELRRVLVVPGR